MGVLGRLRSEPAPNGAGKSFFWVVGGVGFLLFPAFSCFFLLPAHLGKLLPIRMRPKGYSLPCTVTGGLTSKFPKESRLEAPSAACRAT